MTVSVVYLLKSVGIYHYKGAFAYVFCAGFVKRLSDPALKATSVIELCKYINVALVLKLFSCTHIFRYVYDYAQKSVFHGKLFVLYISSAVCSVVNTADFLTVDVRFFHMLLKIAPEAYTIGTQGAFFILCDSKDF